MSLQNRARSTFHNGIYAVADYVTPQLGLLLTAPYLLRHLGAASFGILLLATAAVSSGALLSSGFGDAGIMYVSMYRGRQDAAGVSRVLRAMLTINLALGLIVAAALWLLAPVVSTHIAHLDASLQAVCTTSLRIGAVLLSVRAMDGVFISVLRAHEQYSPAARVAMASRVGSLLAAVALVALGFHVVAVLVATLVIASLAVIIQGVCVGIYVGQMTLLPSRDIETIHMIAGYGCYSWLQVLSAIAFSQVDRLVVGVYLGAPALAYYGICTQVAQPIHGIVSAAFHVLFPHLSSRFESESLSALRSTIAKAFRSNLLLVTALSMPLICFSYPLLKLWMGQEFAGQAWISLSILSAAFGLLAMNVTAHYSMLAMGEVRRVTWVNLAAGGAMLLAMLLLTPHFGVKGTACARIVYGPITWLLYIRLYKRLHPAAVESTVATSLVIQEGR